MQGSKIIGALLFLALISGAAMAGDGETGLHQTVLQKVCNFRDTESCTGSDHYELPLAVLAQARTDSLRRQNATKSDSLL